MILARMRCIAAAWISSGKDMVSCLARPLRRVDFRIQLDGRS